MLSIPRGLAAALLLALATQARAADAAPWQQDPATGPRAAKARGFTIACEDPQACRPQAGPGAADRDVHPFAGPLGRPCAYRRRDTPSGPRTVRVCF